MDIVNPQLIRVGKRIYRKNPIPAGFASNSNVEESQPDFAQEEDDQDACEPQSCMPVVTLVSPSSSLQSQSELDELDDEERSILKNLQIIPTLGSQHRPSCRIKINISQQLIKFIIGKKGETKARVEHELKTQITIPRQGQQGPIVIDGLEPMAVIRTRRRLLQICESSRNRLPPSHFISLPIGPLSSELRERFGDFKRQVLETCSADRGVEASIFQVAEKLHLTVFVMVLLDVADEKRAETCLNDAFDAVIRPTLSSASGAPLRVSVAGLDYMNDDPTAVDVLYANCTELTPTGEPAALPSRLQRLCDELLRFFKTRGLVAGERQRASDSVKLHVTLMNTRFRQDPHGGLDSGPTPTPARGARESFDASNILGRYRAFEFGVLELRELHLSVRHSVDPRNGFYRQAISLPLFKQ